MIEQHTPGPLNTQKDSGGWIQVRKGDLILANVNPHASAGIEEVFPPPHGNESPPSKERIAEAEANGILFAAAPDMLKALEDCITNERATCIVQNDVAYMIRRFQAINDICREAIARATGQQ